MAERIPDNVLKQADEVVNIDLTADELVDPVKRRENLCSGQNRKGDLNNFFQSEKILQLRELALKEVASQVERKIETELPRGRQFQRERFMACISSNHEIARMVIRKTARLATYYHSQLVCIICADGERRWGQDRTGCPATPDQ